MAEILEEVKVYQGTYVANTRIEGFMMKLHDFVNRIMYHLRDEILALHFGHALKGLELTIRLTIRLAPIVTN